MKLISARAARAPLLGALCLGALLTPLDAASAEGEGSVLLSESTFEVQTKVGFSWIWTVGTNGLAPGEEIRVHDPVFHGMRWSKWGDVTPWAEGCTPLTGAQHSSSGLVTAHVEREGVPLAGVVSLERSNCTASNQRCRGDIHEDAWTSLYLEGEEALQAGDAVVMVMGDEETCRTDCEAAGNDDCSICDDCGFETPDRAFPQIRWQSERCEADGDCHPLEDALLEITSEPAMQTVYVEAPSQVLVGEDFALKAALLDELGNAVSRSTATLTVDLQGADGLGQGQSHTLGSSDGGWHDFDARLDAPGIYRLEIDADGQVGVSNPIEVLADEPENRIFWGDIHVHHGLTWTNPEGNREDLNHDYARDVIGLDIVAESMKASGIEIDEDNLWEELQENCVGQTVEGSYLVMLAFEWMGDVVADETDTQTEGHHNVYYNACEAPLGTHDIEVIDSVEGAEHGLWHWVEQVQQETGVQAVTIPHATRFTGHNFDIANPQLQTLAEVWSEWGDNTTFAPEGAAGDSGSTQELLRKGLRLGWIGASDNHDGWMGNPFSKKNVASGLGAWIAPALTRADIFTAMQERHTYATTGHRPILYFEAVDTAEAGGEELRVQQGSEYLARAPELQWRVYGTRSIETILLQHIKVDETASSEILLTQSPAALDVERGSFTVDWDGISPEAYWLEITQEDGEKAWSSPIWLTADCNRRSERAIDPLQRCVDAVDTGPQDSGEDEGGGDDTGSVPADSGDPGVRSRCGCGGGGAVGAGLMILLLGGLRRRRI